MAETYPAPQPEGENPFWATLCQPRVVLVLLAAWEVIGAGYHSLWSRAC